MRKLLLLLIFVTSTFSQTAVDSVQEGQVRHRLLLNPIPTVFKTKFHVKYNYDIYKGNTVWTAPYLATSKYSVRPGILVGYEYFFKETYNSFSIPVGFGVLPEPAEEWSADLRTGKIIDYNYDYASIWEIMSGVNASKRYANGLYFGVYIDVKYFLKIAQSVTPEYKSEWLAQGRDIDEILSGLPSFGNEYGFNLGWTF